MNRFHTPYPDYDVLKKWNTPSWNDQTREVIAKRLRDIPPRRFFTPEEWAIVEAAQARLIPQPDRADPVPITPWIDRKLFEDDTPGYRYADMPPMQQAWRTGLAAIDAESRARFTVGFAQLTGEGQDQVLRDIQNGEVRTKAWGDMPPKKFFSEELLKEVAAIYYAHPDAWNEIGFGGPASPRGYVRMGFDRRDGWEAKLAR